MSRSTATLCVIAAASLWGCIALFTRALNGVGLDPMQITAVRMVVGMVGIGGFLLLADREKLRVALRDLWLFIGTGIISLTLFNLCYFTMVQQSEASIAVVLLYTSPVFVMLMSALFFKERITARKVLALVLTMAGCILVAGVLGGAVQLSGPLALVGIASGFFYATYTIFGNIALRRYHPLTVAFYTFVAASLCSLLLCDCSEIGTTITTQPVTVLYILGIGVLCTLVPYVLYNLGLAHMEPSRAGILATAEPVVGSAIGIFVFGDSTGALKILGMSLILASVVVLSLPGKSSRTEGGGNKASQVQLAPEAHTTPATN